MDCWVVIGEVLWCIEVMCCVVGEYYGVDGDFVGVVVCGVCIVGFVVGVGGCCGNVFWLGFGVFEDLDFV